MELDTGVSVIGQADYGLYLRKHCQLEDTTMKLHTYTGEGTKPLEKTNVSVGHGQPLKRLTLYVLEGDVPALFGRSWLKEIRIT